jgi:hypothetical protein
VADSVGRLAQSGKPLERAAGLYADSSELRPVLIEYCIIQSGKPLKRAARLHLDSPEFQPILIEYYALRDIATRTAAFQSARRQPRAGSLAPGN